MTTPSQLHPLLIFYPLTHPPLLVCIYYLCYSCLCSQLCRAVQTDQANAAYDTLAGAGGAGFSQFSAQSMYNESAMMGGYGAGGGAAGGSSMAAAGTQTEAPIAPMSAVAVQSEAAGYANAAGGGGSSYQSMSQSYASQSYSSSQYNQQSQMGGGGLVEEPMAQQAAAQNAMAPAGGGAMIQEPMVQRASAQNALAQSPSNLQGDAPHSYQEQTSYRYVIRNGCLSSFTYF